VKTIFLCRYLHSEVLCREDHEVGMLSLHLLQNCMVYVNTLMRPYTTNPRAR
jgi:TnpA family transposase